ncbi:MAG: leucine-rich repeat protein [Clostridia bacterium]|nr:leucine-rich repeat protein [Clostridia bacterium]
MKSYLKLLLAALLALTLIFVCVSCDGGEGSGSAGGGAGGTDITIVPNPDPAIDTYLVDFVYRYTTTYINDFDRMEVKEYNQRVERIEIPVNNTGFTAEHKAKIDAILYKGYGFAGWYSEWDSENNAVAGSAYDFASATGAITKDLVFYADRGDLAGTNVSWKITTVGEGKEAINTLTIKGTGSTFDYENAEPITVPWYDVRTTIHRIVIEEGVTVIGKNTFNGLTNVSEIVFPESLVEIRDSAFKNNKKLKLLETPENLVTLGDNAFSYNTALKGIVLNDGLETIGSSAFNGSNNATYVVIPASLKSIGASAFHPGSTNGSENMSKLKTVYSRGTEAHFNSIEIGISNTWFSDLASVYYTPEDLSLVETTPGPYWSYDETTGEPVPKYFIVKYMLDSSIYGSKIPFAFDYLKTDVTYEEVDVEEIIVNEETGEEETVTHKETVAVVKATATKANELYPKTLKYHGFEFVSFDYPVDKSTGAEVEMVIKEGTVFSGDIKVTCSSYIKGSKASGYLSKNNGIRWSYSDGIVSIGTVAKRGTEENVISFFASKYSKTVNASTAISDVIAADKADEFAANLMATFSVGDATYASCATVADLATKIAADQSALGVFKIWDYLAPEDTGGLWANGRSNAGKVKAVVFAEDCYIEHIGSYAFAGLVSISDIQIPASVKTIDVTAFSGCSIMTSVYFKGTDAASCAVVKSGVATDKIVTSNDAFTGMRATVYAKTEAPTAESGNYWWEGANKSIVAWKLDNGVLTLGGPAVMYDFESADKAPWYAAKDSISSVVIEGHITSVSANLVNGYTGVTSIQFKGGDVRIIPKTAFAGTGVLANTASYNSKGLLIINEYLLATKTDAAFVEVPFYTIAIAEGALDGCTAVKELYIPSTVQGLHANVFEGKAIETIYYESASVTWKALTAGVTLPEGVKVCLMVYNPEVDEGFYGFEINEDGSYTIYQGSDEEAAE